MQVKYSTYCGFDRVGSHSTPASQKQSSADPEEGCTQSDKAQLPSKRKLNPVLLAIATQISERARARQPLLHPALMQVQQRHPLLPVPHPQQRAARAHRTAVAAVPVEAPDLVACNHQISRSSWRSPMQSRRSPMRHRMQLHGVGPCDPARHAVARQLHAGRDLEAAPRGGDPGRPRCRQRREAPPTERVGLQGDERHDRLARHRGGRAGEAAALAACGFCCGFCCCCCACCCGLGFGDAAKRNQRFHYPSGARLGC